MAVPLSNELRKLLDQHGADLAATARITTVTPPIVKEDQFACVATDAAELRAAVFEPAGLAGGEPARRIPASARARAAFLEAGVAFNNSINATPPQTPMAEGDADACVDDVTKKSP